MVVVMHKWALLMIFGFVSELSAAVYSVNTDNFTEVFGSYSTNDNISGVVVTTSNVTPNVGLVDVTADLVSYSFSDGVQTLDQNNSTILFFSLAVDGSNQITQTAITVWKTPVTTMIGGLVEGMDIYTSTTFAQVIGFKDADCSMNNGPGGSCSEAISASTNSGLYFFFDPIFANGFDF